MEERFDLDFHILTPGGRDEHIMRMVDGKVVVVPPKTAPQTADLPNSDGLQMASM